MKGMKGPLHGIRVLDVSRILAGPFCTMLLADMGAEVVKVEIPSGGDPARSLEPTIGGDSVFFISINRGKKSITLDLSTQDGKRIFRRLVPHFDVLVENFVPGTMARFGLDYPSLIQINPRLVYASISGFGQDGPRAKFPALDVTVMAMSGLMSITGQPGREPLRPGVSLADSVAGVFTALAIVSALLQRQSGGKGQHIDMSMLDCQVTMMENSIARYFGTGKIPVPVGTRNPMAAPFQVFHASDRYFAAAIFTNNLDAWRCFCRVAGRPELGEDERFKNNTERTKHVDALTEALQQSFVTLPVTHWMKVFSEANIPCAPVNNVAEMTEDAQVRHRGMIATIPHSFAGTWKVANTPFKMSAGSTGPAGASPELGEHTRTILRELLGLSDNEIDALKADGTM